MNFSVNFSSFSPNRRYFRKEIDTWGFNLLSSSSLLHLPLQAEPWKQQSSSRISNTTSAWPPHTRLRITTNNNRDNLNKNQTGENLWRFDYFHPTLHTTTNINSNNRSRNNNNNRRIPLLEVSVIFVSDSSSPTQRWGGIIEHRRV